MKKWLDIVRKGAAFTAVCVYVSTSAFIANAKADEPVRIGSTSLCGDTYLLALKPQGLAALSWQSRDPVSLATSTQKTLPQIWDDAEVLIAAELTHLVYGPGEGAKSAGFLTGTQITQLDWGEDFQTVQNNYLKLGRDLGFNARNFVHAIDDKLDNLIVAENRPKVLYLARDGSSAGPGTYVDAVITAAGGQNILSAPSWHKPDPERLLTLEPDLILTSFFDDGYDSANALPIRHQAIRDFIARHERVEIPGSLWPCAGPGLIDAAQLLNSKIRELNSNTGSLR